MDDGQAEITMFIKKNIIQKTNYLPANAASKATIFCHIFDVIDTPVTVTQ
jgi:hypothetical protein